MEYNVAFQSAALGIVVFITFLYLCMKRVPTRNNAVYLGLLMVSLVNVTLDVASIKLITDNEGVWNPFIQLVDSLYFCSVILVPFMVFAYILVCSGNYYFLTGWQKVTLTMPIPICFALFFLIPSELFYENGIAYSTGAIAVIAEVAAAFYIVTSFVLLALIRNKMKRHLLLSFLGVLIIEATASTLQFLFGFVYLISYAIMLMCVFLFFTLENPTLSIESASGLFNRQGFITLVRTLFEDRRTFGVICVHLEDYHRICASHGIRLTDAYVKNIAYGIEKIHSGIVFLTAKDEICIVFKGESKQIADVAYHISSFLKHSVFIHDNEYLPDYYICVFHCPNNAPNVDAVFENIYYSLYSKRLAKDDRVIVFDKALVEKQKRTVRIQSILKEAVNNDGFLVHYQPIYSSATGKIASAEALVRLKDDKTLGYVGPDEFIPIAENCGVILHLGMMVFERVCRFIKRYKLYESGLEFIEINLSAVQCMQNDLAEQLFLVMDRYGIPAHFINLEITETSAMDSNDMLNSNMKRMIDRGATFSLDDYGAGYSNVQYLMSFPFSIIKLDKEMVWTYFDETNQKAKTVLESNILMMKKLELKIIAEGVETVEQVERLIEIGVDYLQGFYFSKPIDELDFMGLIA